MKITLLTLSLFLCFLQDSYGQGKAYYNQTELGVLFGQKANIWSGEKESRVDVSLITFHGIKVSKSHVVGFSVGFDQYETISIIPIALGWRGFLGRENRPQLIGGFDIGGGSALLEKKVRTEWNESWYYGGFLVSPSIGVKLPSKKGNNAVTMTLAYKRQELGFFVGNFEFNPNPRPTSDSSLPSKYNSSSDTSYLFHSLVGRIGFIF